VVHSIEEIKITTPACWNFGNSTFRHCAYLVTTTSGRQLVLDPTGVQFSPDWPLISPLWKYQLIFCHGDVRVRNLERRPLCTNLAGTWQLTPGLFGQ
jgi:hypothetical protein